jgi:hypothetical protein
MPYESMSKLWIARLSLTGRHVIVRTKPHTILFGLYPGRGMHHGSDKHLAYDDGMNLGCCEVMAITVDYRMAIITPNNLYFMLSCRPTPPDALPVQYG